MVAAAWLAAGTGVAAQSPSRSHESRPAAARIVAAELFDYGARNAFVYVSAGGRGSTATAGAGPPRHPVHRFRIGSNSKTFVAVIVLQLAEEGTLGLDDPLEDYLPRAVPRGSEITIRQLLNHTSGLANYTDFPEWLERVDDSTTLRPVDVLEFAAAKKREFARPGASWSYSNTNYTALGLVIEKVTGHTLRQELARRIVRPLELRSTELASTRRLPDLRDAGVNPNVPWAAGGIVSSAGDLARFFAALLSGRLVSEGSLKEMQQTVQDPVGPSRYGLGLEPTDLACGTFWGNAGRVLDYSSYATASADGRRVAVVMVRGRSDRNPDLARLLCT